MKPLIGVTADLRAESIAGEVNLHLFPRNIGVMEAEVV